VQRLSPETLTSLMKMGSTVGKLLDVGDTVRGTFRKKRDADAPAGRDE